MIIYVLSGHGERGKSTVLKLLAANLLIKAQNATRAQEILNEVQIERIMRRNGLFVSVRNVEEHLTIDGKVVCVYSAGDDKGAIDAATDFFVKYRCDVGFCAARSKGETLAALRKFGRANNVPIEIRKKAMILNADGFPKLDDYIDELNAWEAEELAKLV